MKQSIIRWAGSILASVITLCLLSGVSIADTIKIGVASPYSGDLASYGIPAKNAAEIAVKAINAKGGILGKQVELLAEDDVCEPNTATTVAAKLVAAKVVAVIGHLCSGATEAALPTYRDAKVIVISPASTNPTLTLSGKYPNFFRTIAHDAAQADLQVAYALKLGTKKAAVIHDKGTYGKGLASLARDGLEKANVEVVLFEGITPGAVDYSALIRKISRAKVDTVVFGGYHPEASKIIKQARQKKINANFISGDGVKDPSFLKVAGKYAEKYYASAPTDVSQVAMAKSVSDEYKKVFGSDVGTFSLQAYAALQALAGSIEAAGSTNYDDVVKAMRAKKVNTPLGTINFDASGDVLGAGFAMYQVMDGKFVEAK
ncbi:MAG: branched-chain amino acid ABC transporter substrate-binding protein [SAR324 cluster bacterium]|nr:branched-chain amino acid ABC transporter substrate-binding protein [SAR324 cluster bacterium]